MQQCGHMVVIACSHMICRLKSFARMCQSATAGKTRMQSPSNWTKPRNVSPWRSSTEVISGRWVRGIASSLSVYTTLCCSIHNEYVVHGSPGNLSQGHRRTYVIAYRTVDTIAMERKAGFTHSHNDKVNWDTFREWQTGENKDKQLA
jgi:hypothetical protein